MKPIYQPQPYFRLPTLKPEGNYVQTRYGNRQRRTVTSIINTTWNVPAGATLAFDLATTPDISGNINNDIKIGKLMRETQLLIPYEVSIGIQSQLVGNNSLSWQSVHLAIKNAANIFWGAPLTGFALSPTINGLAGLYKVPMPPIRWDDFSLMFSNAPLYPMIDLNTSLDVIATVNNPTAGALLFALFEIVLYDVIQLEELLYAA